MQAPTSSQERDELDETDERTDLSIGHLLRSRFAMDSRFARIVKARKKQDMHYNGGVPVEAI